MPGFNINPFGGGYSGVGPSNTVEVRRKHRWVFETLGRGTGQFSQAELLILQSASRPSFKFEEPEMHHNQEVARFAGKQDWDPVTRLVPPENFARFVAALESASYRDLLTDERNVPSPDPQRDLFFERARLGLLERPDTRPSARSQSEFLSRKEKHGGLLRSKPVLPIELVLQGGLEDFGFAAFPRVRLPRESPDAFLE